MYVLNDLWLGNVAPSERLYEKGSPYAELMKKVSQSADTFYHMLSPEGKKAYDVHFNNEMELTCMSECDSFVLGFRLGARMILDVVGEYDSPMFCKREEICGKP